jgi:hypothetical protein
MCVSFNQRVVESITDYESYSVTELSAHAIPTVSTNSPANLRYTVATYCVECSSICVAKLITVSGITNRATAYRAFRTQSISLLSETPQYQISACNSSWNHERLSMTRSTNQLNLSLSAKVRYSTEQNRTLKSRNREEPA